MLAEYINDMYQNGEPHGYAADFISAISRAVPMARAQIPTARRWLKNWTRGIQRTRALPIPVQVLTWLAGLALAFGRVDLAALLPTAFACTLRTSEVFNLKCQDVVFSPDGTKAIVTLRETKTSGPNCKEAVVHDRVIVCELLDACAKLRPAEHIYSRPARFLGDDLKWLASLVGFSHQSLLPYSLRRGRATWHMHKYGSLSLTALVGRWKHERTAKIYIDGAAAEWASWQLTEAANKHLRRASVLWRRYYK